LRTVTVLLLATALLSICNQLTSPTALTAIAEALPRRTRSGTLAIVYALAIAIFGGSAQYIMKELTVLSANPLAPAWYLSAAIVIGFLAMLAFPETSPARRRSPV